MLLEIPYRDPIDQGPLIEEAAAFRNPRNGYRYPVRDGIPVFLPCGAVEGPNARYQKLYDRTALIYDLATGFYARWMSGGGSARRRVYLDLLELAPGASLLEVSVGTGMNWSQLDRNVEFYGLDLSAGMLGRCRRRARRLELSFRLCQGLAEHLPFPDSVFDSVLHMGGINFFTDPRAALYEMVRVAKPGMRLVIVDETEAVAKRYENAWIAGAFFKNRPRAIAAPVNLLPPGMREVAVRQIWDGDLYVLTFRKP